ncbi:LPXTG cell wall anchor domain-containing protein [Pseudalkalibacillus caeni]|uniref:LPXTG cell wall anchor domain-containing protein n=1 Tax=Exobacillus caeni TaxID=2574798 RepID=A0A5R9F4C6_9BACL|nr:LPXTG cell wall anchor domain-containing protein [Pseudalkalibacillus caeni]TLS37206.1 LPXTG cell wall anchor domain-containing protein [Pseudalkalibacillus caeni]
MKRLYLGLLSFVFLAIMLFGGFIAQASHGSSDKNCDDFSSKQEVMDFWYEHGYNAENDPSDLDRDNDGLPCEVNSGEWDSYVADKEDTNNNNTDEDGQTNDQDEATADGEEGGELPDTASNHITMVIVGAFIMAAGALLFIRRKVRA